MLVVRAEIWPGGDPERAFQVGEIQAANISDLAEASSYAVEIIQIGDASAGVARWHQTFVLADHTRRLGAWELVRRILASSAAITSVADQSP